MEVLERIEIARDVMTGKRDAHALVDYNIAIMSGEEFERLPRDLRVRVIAADDRLHICFLAPMNPSWLYTFKTFVLACAACAAGGGLIRYAASLDYPPPNLLRYFLVGFASLAAVMAAFFFLASTTRKPFERGTRIWVVPDPTHRILPGRMWKMLLFIAVLTAAIGALI